MSAVDTPRVTSATPPAAELALSEGPGGSTSCTNDQYPLTRANRRGRSGMVRGGVHVLYAGESDPRVE